MHIENNVLTMPDGVRFLYSGNHMQFDYLTGKKKVSTTALKTFQKNIKKRNDFCKKRNILYKHVIFPSKPVVLSHKYPELKIKSIINDDFMLDNVIYPLSEYLNTDNPFFKTDTHPTPNGSWQLTKLIASFSKVELSEPSFTKSQIHGDLNKMLNDSTLEHYNKFDGMNNHFLKTWDINNNNTVTGNNEIIRIIKNPLSKTQNRVLIFGDSFFNFNLNEQLSLIFNEVIFIRTPNFLYELVDYLEPDIILSGQVERYIPNCFSDENYKYPLLHTLFCSSVNKPLNTDFATGLNAILSKKDSDEYIRWHNNISANLLKDSALIFEEKKHTHSFRTNEKSL